MQKSYTVNKKYTVNFQAKKDQIEYTIRAISSIFSLNQSWRELNGVIGENESEHILSSLFGSGMGEIKDIEKYNQDCIELMNSLPEIIKEENIPGILLKVKTLKNEHMPIVDNRVTKEEKEKRDLEQLENMKKWDLEKENSNKAFIDQFCDSNISIEIPQGKSAVTIELNFDDSDSMTDYYHPHHSYGLKMVLAIVDKCQQRESIARKILEIYPELSKLNWSWHTENYSMGHGNYLQSESVGTLPEITTYSGYNNPPYWYEIEISSFEKSLLPFRGYTAANTTKPEQTKEVNPTNTTNNANTTYNVEYDRDWTWLKFPGKPEQTILESLKSNGWRFSGKRIAWYNTKHIEESVINSTIGG